MGCAGSIAGGNMDLEFSAKSRLKQPQETKKEIKL